MHVHLPEITATPTQLTFICIRVKMLDRLAINLLLLASSAAVLAHPGADVRTEFLERQEHLNNPARRTLSECHARLEARGHYAAELERRMTKINGLRSKRGLQAAPGAVQKREGGARAGCVLDPEVTEGPFCKLLYLEAMDT